jgi:G3E family GTPase
MPLAPSSSENSFPENELLVRQLIYADRILINKIDLVPEPERSLMIEFMRECIEKVNPNAVINQTTYSKVDLNALIEPNNGQTVSSAAKDLTHE